MYDKYERMKDAGLTPMEVSSAAISDGLNLVAILGMLRSVFGLGLVQGKEAYTQARYGMSLAEHQERLIPVYEEALAEMNEYQVKAKEKLD